MCDNSASLQSQQQHESSHVNTLRNMACLIMSFTLLTSCTQGGTSQDNNNTTDIDTPTTTNISSETLKQVKCTTDGTGQVINKKGECFDENAVQAHGYELHDKCSGRHGYWHKNKSICLCTHGYFHNPELNNPNCSPIRDFCGGQHDAKLLYVKGKPKCNCEGTGRTGDSCEQNTRNICNDNGEGTIIDGKKICSCRAGYIGEDCGQNANDTLCNGRGTAIDENGFEMSGRAVFNHCNDCAQGFCGRNCQLDSNSASHLSDIQDICNGVDDDCDGFIDEDFSSETTHCGVFTCATTGQNSCDNGILNKNCYPDQNCIAILPGSVDFCSVSGTAKSHDGDVTLNINLGCNSPKAPQRSHSKDFIHYSLPNLKTIEQSTNQE